MINLIRIIGLERIYVIRQLITYFKLFLKYSTPHKLLNLIKCEYEVLSNKTILKSRPYGAKLETTNLCNLECKFCNRKKIKYSFGSINYNDYEKIFNQIKNNLYFCALHYMGEPLLNKDIIKIIKYTHENKVATQISTNLHHLNDEMIEQLINSGLDILTISLDGTNQKSYSKYRKKGNYDLVINNIKKLVKTKRILKSKTPFIEIQFIVFKHNENEIDKIKKISKDIGVDSLIIKPGRIPDSDWLPSKDYRIKKREWKKQCWWLWRTTTISWNGKVMPCCKINPNKSFGDLKKNNFENIWNNKQFRNSRMSFKSNEECKTPCSKCKTPYLSIYG